MLTKDGWTLVTMKSRRDTLHLKSGTKYHIKVRRTCGNRRLCRPPSRLTRAIRDWLLAFAGTEKLPPAMEDAAVALADLDRDAAFSGKERRILDLALNGEPLREGDLELLRRLATHVEERAAAWQDQPTLGELAREIGEAIAAKLEKFSYLDTWSTRTAVVAYDCAEDGTLTVYKSDGGRLRVGRNGGVEVFDQALGSWRYCGSVADYTVEEAQARGILGLYTRAGATQLIESARGQRESLQRSPLQSGVLWTGDDLEATGKVLEALDEAIAEATNCLNYRDYLGATAAIMPGFRALHEAAGSESKALEALGTRIDVALMVAEATQKICVNSVGAIARSLWGPLGGALAQGLMTGLTSLIRGDYAFLEGDVLTAALAGSGLIKSAALKSFTAGTVKAIKSWTKEGKSFEEMGLDDWKVLIGIALAEGAFSYLSNRVATAVGGNEAMQTRLRKLFEVLGADDGLSEALEKGLSKALIKVLSGTPSKLALKLVGTWASALLKE